MSSVAFRDQPRTFLGHPAGLYVLFFTEMWERFGFYCMEAVFVYYMQASRYEYLRDNASMIYGLYLAGVYFTPFFGGLLAEWRLGYPLSIVGGALALAAGYGLLALEPAVCFAVGLLGIIVGNFSGTLVLYLVLLAHRREQLGLQFDHRLLRAVNRFGLPLMATGLALWVTNFGDRLMLSKLLHGSYRLTEVGQYSLANKISSAMVLLFTAFQVAWPAFAYSIEDEGAAKRAYSYVLTYLMYIAAWAAVGLSLFAPWIVHLLARKHGYWPADTAIPALAYSSVFYAGFTVVTIATGRTRRTQFNWVAAALAAALNFTLNLWLIPAYGMLGAAYATLAAYALLMVVRTWNAQKMYPVAYQWRRVAVLLLAAGGLTLAGELLPRSLAIAFGLTFAFPLVLAPLGFYLPVERQRLRRLLPAHN